MTSPVWRFKQRCERAAEVDRIRAAAAAAEQRTLEALAEDSARYELLVAGLNNDRARISALPQGSGRLPLKKECCAIYLPYVESYIKAGKQHRNEVLVQVMIWLFDLGDIAAAMRLAEIAIDQKQPMPERFKSTVSEFVADSVLEWAVAQRRAGGAVAPYFDWVFERLITLPLHDVQRAKYYKFAAERAAERGVFSAALNFCDQAITYDAGAKVKTLRDRCAKEVARLEEAAKHSLNDTTPAGGAAGASGDAAMPQAPDETGASPASLGDAKQ